MHEDWSKRASASGNTPAATSPVLSWSLRAGSAWIRSALVYSGICFNRNAGSARVRFSFDEGRLLNPVAAAAERKDAILRRVETCGASR